jgi:NAD(P)-dependent dehydrogenase (short-subunit alcohol dehydrogenase family)
MADVRSGLGVASLVVCGAGVVSESPIVELDDAEWHRVLDVSLTGAFLLLRAALPGLCEQGGSVVAISSGWGTKGYPNGSHYAAAKAGVEALVKSAALEAAGAGVRVNAVAPGPVLTPLLDHIGEFDEWRRQREAAIPLGRLGQPADVVGPVLFLLGDESSYVTGQVLHVNGGLLMP